ncbi:MAG TPA: hypothetical protein VD838_05915 [Anaeromyxobacteraceae bacterium]|nr:hypothetical protein [Anaeromyxobacteraceae bacterium]
MIGTRCEPCGKLALPEDVATRIHARLLRSSATRKYELWPCPQKAGRFHLGLRPKDDEGA